MCICTKLYIASVIVYMVLLYLSINVFKDPEHPKDTFLGDSTRKELMIAGMLGFIPVINVLLIIIVFAMYFHELATTGKESKDYWWNQPVKTNKDESNITKSSSDDTQGVDSEA